MAPVPARPSAPQPARRGATDAGRLCRLWARARQLGAAASFGLELRHPAAAECPGVLHDFRRVARAWGCGLNETPAMWPGMAARRAGSAAPAPPGADQGACAAAAALNSCRSLPASATASAPSGPNASAVIGSPACRQGRPTLTVWSRRRVLAPAACGTWPARPLRARARTGSGVRAPQNTAAQRDRAATGRGAPRGADDTRSRVRSRAHSRRSCAAF